MSSKINANLRKKIIYIYTNKQLGIVFMVLFAGASPRNINYCLFVTQTECPGMKLAGRQGCKLACGAFLSQLLERAV